MPEFNPNSEPGAPIAPQAPNTQPVAASPAPANTATPAAFDVNEFNQSLSQFGPDWNLSNWKEKLTETRRTLSKKGNEYDRLQREKQALEEEVGPFRQAMRETPGFRQHMEQSVQAFYQNQALEPTGQGYAPQYAPPMSGFDPVRQELNEIKNNLKINQFTNDLNRLSESGFKLDQDMADAIIDRAQVPGWDKLDAHSIYFAMYGPQVIAEREMKASQTTAAAIQQNNEAYTPGPGRGPAAPAAAPVDFSSMTPEQFNAYSLMRTKQLMGGM